jgi:hypothetical protein
MPAPIDYPNLTNAGGGREPRPPREKANVSLPIETIEWLDDYTAANRIKCGRSGTIEVAVELLQERDSLIRARHDAGKVRWIGTRHKRGASLLPLLSLPLARRKVCITLPIETIEWLDDYAAASRIRCGRSGAIEIAVELLQERDSLVRARYSIEPGGVSGEKCYEYR